MTFRVVAVAGLLLLGACASRPQPLPFADVALVRAAIISDVDDNGAPLDDPPPVRQVGTRHDVLLLSGGGSLGAFGAGVLAGWTESGKRPVFDVVTGVSTGALMATLAFLGPRHDATLVRAYTGITNRDVYKKRGIIGFARTASVYDRAPLETMIAEIVDEAMLAEVAAEHAKGRRLYVATTNLDAGVSTVWDMGRIARSSSPDKVRLYRDVLAASAAIPGVFSPVYIDQGVVPTTMHVDGGLKTSMLFRSFMLDPKGRNENVWAIVNGHVSYAGSSVPSGTNSAGIMGRSIIEMMRSISYRSVERTYVMTRNAGARFNLAYLPDEEPEVNAIEFDPAAMKRLFESGATLGRAGRWRDEPPRIEPLERIGPQRVGAP
ncbi:patatin-like phospholipase family protein [Polymorphobacter sp.]|uniref:patatin-like phospholipase family protein n=1 Tax=Polymorphobacter sp. TaxID=1909290 RepID=UPI003F718D02